MTRQAAASDPTGFVDFGEFMVIDEIQRVPELLLAIKEQVDADPRTGRYLLTGSARVLGLRALPDTLPGRTETVELWPFSQGEIDGLPDGFVDAAFTDAVALNHTSTVSRGEYAERIVRGGFPESHYRTKDGTEADAVLEDRQGRVVGIEVKASSTVRSDDFRVLRHLADRLGADFVTGLVLYTGTQTLPFGPRLRAVPASALWEIAGP